MFECSAVLDPRRSSDLLKVTHKGLILEWSMEPDTSWLSKCMNFPKILPFVKCLCKEMTCKVSWYIVERLVSLDMCWCPYHIYLITGLCIVVHCSELEE